MKILDQYGNPFNDADLEDAQTSDVSRYGTLPKVYEAIRALTPAKIAAAFKAAEEGDLTTQHTLFAEMEEKDAHIFSEMKKRRGALLTLDWTVKARDDADANETKAAEWVAAHLRNMPDFEDLLFDLTDAIGHGFANIELEWMHVASDKTRRIKQFFHRPQTWFTTDELTRNTLLLRTANGKAEPLRPFGWISHVAKSKSGYIARSGLYRVLAWPYMFKHFSVGDWAEFLETYGMPIRVGKYPVGSTDKEKKTLFAAVMALGRNAAATMPETMQVEFMQAAGAATKTHDPFKAMADWADLAISKAVLGGTLTSQADGKTATNALGTVHNEVRKELVVSDARQLAGTLTRDLVYPLLILNGFNVDYMRCPRFVFDIDETADIVAMSDALPKLAAVMDIGVDYAYQKLGIPKPKDGEVLLKSSQSQVQTNDNGTTNPASAKSNAKLSTTWQYAYLAGKQAGGVIPAKAPLTQLLDAETPQAIMSMVNEDLLKMAQDVSVASNPDEALDILMAHYPTESEDALVEALSKLIFIADLWGMLNA